MSKRGFETLFLFGSALLLSASCINSQVREETLPPKDPNQIELRVSGARLVDSSTAAMQETLPQETLPVVVPQEPVKKVEPKQESKPEAKPETPPAEEKKGDVLEMKPGETQIQAPSGEEPVNQERSVSPFDTDAVFMSAVKALIPENKPITIEKSEILTVPQLLEAIAKFGQFNIAVADGLDDLKISRVNFPNIPLRDAFIAILKRYRLNLTRIGNVLWIDRGNQAGDSMVYRVIRLSSISASSLAAQLSQILAGGSAGGGAAAGSAVPTGGTGSATSGVSTPNGFFTIHPDSNTIFIRSKPELVDAMAKFINAVDFQGRQVLIEMKIFEVSIDDNDRRGGAVSIADYFSVNQVNRTDFLSSFLFTEFGEDPEGVLQDLRPDALDRTGPNTGQTGFLFGFRSGGQDRIRGFLDFIQTIATVDLLSSPRVVASNGKLAEINIIDKIPYIESTTTQGGGGSTTTTSVKFEEVGIKLKVTPTIQEDKHVRLSVEPEVSEEKEKFKDIPVIIKRTSKTEVVVADGEAFAIGGLIKTQVKHKEEKVPLLGDIPLIGWFFKRNEETVKKLELLILITPRIIGDDETANQVTQDQYNSLNRERNSLKNKR